MSQNQSAQSNPFFARYRANAPESKEALNEVLKTVLSHRSVRAFTNAPVTDDQLMQIIAGAQSAATSSNLQAFSVVAVRDPDRKARLAVLADNQDYVEKTPLFLAWCADLSRTKRIASNSLDGADYLEAFLLAVVDAALAAQNAAIAAQSLGLGICYIGALRDHPEKVAQELNLPPQVFALFGMCIGHSDPAKPASVRPRLPQSAVLHFERYNIEQEGEQVAAYNKVHRDFQAGQGMKVADWSERVSARLKDAGALHGRDRLREALHRLGFELR